MNIAVDLVGDIASAHLRFGLLRPFCFPASGIDAPQGCCRAEGGEQIGPKLFDEGEDERGHCTPLVVATPLMITVFGSGGTPMHVTIGEYGETKLTQNWLPMLRIAGWIGGTVMPGSGRTSTGPGHVSTCGAWCFWQAGQNQAVRSMLPLPSELARQRVE